MNWPSTFILALGCTICFISAETTFLAKAKVEPLFTGTVSDTIITYKVASVYQRGTHEIRVLTPLTYSADRHYRVLYILPVGQGTKGSALRRFRELNIHNRYNLILAEMTFEKTPWFGDHVSDSSVRQESYLRDFVIPFVESRYSTYGDREGRLLIGFSKSGWGAFSLIFRNPGFFGYAAAWDTPWMMDSFYFKTQEVFGTPEQMNKYRPDLLARIVRKSFKKTNRLVLGGEDIWGKNLPPASGRSHTEEFHLLLKRLHIKHTFRNDLHVKHSWDKIWIEPEIEELMALCQRNEKSKQRRQ